MDEASSFQGAESDTDAASLASESNSPLECLSASDDIQNVDQNSNETESVGNSRSSVGLTNLNNEDMDSRTQSPTRPTTSSVISTRR